MSGPQTNNHLANPQLLTLCWWGTMLLTGSICSPQPLVTLKPFCTFTPWLSKAADCSQGSQCSECSKCSQPWAHSQQAWRAWEEAIHHTAGSTSMRCVPLHQPMDEMEVIWYLHWIHTIGKDYIQVQQFTDLIWLLISTVRTWTDWHYIWVNSISRSWKNMENWVNSFHAFITILRLLTFAAYEV